MTNKLTNKANKTLDMFTDMKGSKASTFNPQCFYKNVSEFQEVGELKCFFVRLLSKSSFVFWAKRLLVICANKSSLIVDKIPNRKFEK